MRSAILIIREAGKPPSVELFERADAGKVAYKAALLTPGAGVELWTSDGGRVKKRIEKPLNAVAAVEPEPEAVEPKTKTKKSK